MEYLFKYIVYKNLLEIVIIFILGFFLKRLFQTRFYGFVISLAYRFNIDFVRRYVINNINNHKCYTTLELFRDSERFVKYIKHEEYKYYMKIITAYIFNAYSEKLKSQIEEYYRVSFLYSIPKLVESITKDIVGERISHTYQLRKMVDAGVINKSFLNKYLVWTDIFYISLEHRVKELRLIDSPTELLDRYLYVVNDFLLIYMDQIHGVVNAINGDIKKDISEKMTGQYPIL